jgi:hypothetical protein
MTLLRPTIIHGEPEIDEITSLAAQLEVELDEDRVDEARAASHARDEAADMQAERAREGRQLHGDRPLLAPETDDDGEVRALFGRLAEGP